MQSLAVVPQTMTIKALLFLDLILTHIVETLNVKGMMKNKHLAKSIAQQKFYEFKCQLQYKCEDYGIELVEADKFYPSSKLFHECGHKKVDLKLSVHTYHCDKYGYTAGRDYNASVNLASYSV